jgi:cystine transport system substrate-binding protein
LRKRVRQWWLLLALLPGAAFADLTVGLEGTYPPFSFQDARGQLVGFEVDFARSLAEHMKEKIRFAPSRWDGLLAGVSAGRFDLVINEVSITPEREQVYLFSEPYCYSAFQLVEGLQGNVAGPDDLAGRHIGVGMNSIHEIWLRQHAPAARIQSYDDDATRNQDLLVGRLDAMLNDRNAVAYLVKQYPGRLKLAGPPFDWQRKAVVLRKGREELRDRVTQAIAAMRQDGSLIAISQKWFGVDVTVAPE